MEKAPLKGWPLAGESLLLNGPSTAAGLVVDSLETEAGSPKSASKGLNTAAPPFRSNTFRPSPVGGPTVRQPLWGVNGSDQQGCPMTADSTFSSPPLVSRFAQLKMTDNMAPHFPCMPSNSAANFNMMTEPVTGYADLSSTSSYGRVGSSSQYSGCELFDNSSYELYQTLPQNAYIGYEQTVVDVQQQEQYPQAEPVHASFAYTGIPSYLAKVKGSGSVHGTFLPDPELRQELVLRQLASCSTACMDAEQSLPERVDDYYQLCPLEPSGRSRAASEQAGYFGWVTTAYRAVCRRDGLLYCLRRVHGFRLVNVKSLSAVDKWRGVQLPHVVRLKEAFTTKAFGDTSLVLVYDFHPCAETLHSRHLSDAAANEPQADGTVKFRSQIPEATLWQYVVTISSALRAIHGAGRFARTIDATKVLIVGKSKLMINCCGLFDVLSYEQMENTPALLTHCQQEDLLNFGRLVLALACSSMLAFQRDHLPAAMDYVCTHYSPDMKNVILCLLQVRTRSIMDIMPMIGARFYACLEAAERRSEMLENEIMKEMENGRLLRLLCKLCTVNDRSRLGPDTHWSRTGDRYLLKLFRNYVFHQETEEGTPWVDMAHIVQCLNKLDAGVEEKIMLMSSDQQSVLVVSYKDLHRCLSCSFKQVLEVAGVVEAET